MNLFSIGTWLTRRKKDFSYVQDIHFTRNTHDREETITSFTCGCNLAGKGSYNLQNIFSKHFDSFSIKTRILR
jgi:hypothetical protein